MSGLYFHIPFCRKACHYCDFHFSTSLKHQEAVTEAIITELHQRKDFIKSPLQSIYFGGGTPSVLSEKELESIFNAIHKNFNIANDVEITFEANPEDISNVYAAHLARTGINRVSLGTQTFNDSILQYLNRSHRSAQVYNAIDHLRNHDISALSLDLIFGLPDSSPTVIEEDLKQLISIHPDHISAYWLTIEEKTVFGNWAKKGVLQQITDEKALLQWDIIRDSLAEAGYNQYEISNYALPGKEAFHNSNYWKGAPYLGIGPSAHSFDGTHRYWNIANNTKYVSLLSAGDSTLEKEELSPEDHINEYIMTRIRTSWGINLDEFEKKFNLDLVQTQNKTLSKYLDSKDIRHDNRHIYITRQGQQIVDQIASDLFIL